MTEYISLTKLIAEVGFLVVCGGVVIYTLMQMLKTQREQLEQYQKRADDDRQAQNKFIEELLEKVLSETRYDIAKDPTCDHIMTRINELLSELRRKTKAQRAMYVAYHNGTRDLKGIHFSSMSCRAEVVQSGFKSRQLNFQNIPRTFLCNWCNKIREMKYDVVPVPQIDAIKEVDYQMYDYYKEAGVQAIYGKAILDESYEVRGYVCIEYESTYLPEAKVIFNQMVSTAAKISEELILLDREQQPIYKKNNLNYYDKF